MARTPSVAAPLGDFTADSRIVRLVIMAALIGVISAFVALGLVRLIGLFTNLAYFHRIAGTLASPADAIGTGGPFGAEGPIIMTGGAFGSLFAQAFHMSPAERKTLLVSGAAGGMAAVFGTPVAAALLAVELLLFEWKPRSFIPVAC